MATPPPPPPPTQVQQAGSHPKRKVITAVAVVLAVVFLASLALVVWPHTGPKCTDANTAALSAIAGGAGLGNALPLELGEAQAYPAKLTLPNGSQENGYLVAASTPSGVGVWALDASAYNSGNGNIQAVIYPAQETANWGPDLHASVSPDDVQTVTSCLYPNGTPL
jgi:hypothetical protein